VYELDFYFGLKIIKKDLETKICTYIMMVENRLMNFFQHQELKHQINNFHSILKLLRTKKDISIF
jgi:hypothetical protein